MIEYVEVKLKVVNNYPDGTILSKDVFNKMMKRENVQELEKWGNCMQYTHT